MTVTDAQTSSLAREVAERLHATGWAPLPLPPRAKSEPPTGFTGYAGRYPTASNIKHWDWSGNIAIRLPPGVVGVDVDVYKGGDTGLMELIDKYGDLPYTIRSTSRDDGSGIALFRVPVGTTLRTNPANGVDMIQPHHRYMVVWPSIHPEGMLYQWVDDRTGEGELMDGDDAPIPLDELPELPWAWVEGLTVVKSGAVNAATPDEVRDFVELHTERRSPGSLAGIRTHINGYEGSRHDTLVGAACWALREAAAGLYTAEEAIREIHEWWKRVMDNPARRDGGEFGSAVMWAVAQVAAEPERVAEIRNNLLAPVVPITRNPNIDPATGEVAPSSINLPDEFWESRPALRHIRQAAHSRIRSADAVLAFMLARVAAITPPTVKLPSLTGGQGSLNFLIGIISSSGGGKSSAGAVARELLPIERDDIVADHPLGSGEGLTELFFEFVSEEGPDGKQRKIKRQTKKGAFIYLDEGQALAEMGNRKGATLMPTLRAAWSGEVIGQSNASIETHRVLREHSYRLAIAVGFQYEYAAGLLDDAAGGTPQRFVFATATDPAVPDTAPEWPGSLDIPIPPSVLTGTTIEFDPEVATPIKTRARLIVQGKFTPDSLDAHRDLVRMKVAALLAIMDGRLNVTIDDWELAGYVQRSSEAVRATVIAHARESAIRTEDARTLMMARRAAALEDDASRRALISGSKSIANRVHKLGDVVPRRQVTQAVASKHREKVSVEDMAAYAVDQGWIQPAEDGWSPGHSKPA